jgi:N utilization substance protein B
VENLRTIRSRTIADEEMSQRIIENDIIRYIQLSDAYTNICKSEKFESKIDDDLFRKYFLELKNSPSYHKYILSDSTDLKEDYYLLHELYTQIIIADKDSDSLIEDLYPEWADDKHHIKSLALDTLKQISNAAKPNLNELIPPSDKYFVESMVNSYIFHHTEIGELIKKRLTNWDEERVAELDMILLRMGVCEFMYQPEIPVKVTINEYLEIAKNYSTPKSSEFINGILDRLLKDLRSLNLVVKTGRGVVES